MYTHRSQGHSSRCLVKAEENSCWLEGFWFAIWVFQGESQGSQQIDFISETGCGEEYQAKYELHANIKELILNRQPAIRHLFADSK